MRYNLDPTALRALLPLTAKSDRRTLTALHIRPDGVGVATSGHVMGYYRATAEPQTEPIPANGLTIRPGADWKPVLAALKKAVMPAVLDTDAGTLTVYPSKASPVAFVVSLETDYPASAWNGQCVPRSESWGAVPLTTLDPDLLRLFGKGPLALTFSPKPDTGSERAIVVRTSDERFYGVLMPMRNILTPSEPDWLRPNP